MSCILCKCHEYTLKTKVITKINTKLKVQIKEAILLQNEPQNTRSDVFIVKENMIFKYCQICAHLHLDHCQTKYLTK